LGRSNGGKDKIYVGWTVGEDAGVMYRGLKLIPIDCLRYE